MDLTVRHTEHTCPTIAKWFCKVLYSLILFLRAFLWESATGTSAWQSCWIFTKASCTFSVELRFSGRQRSCEFWQGLFRFKADGSGFTGLLSLRFVSPRPGWSAQVSLTSWRSSFRTIARISWFWLRFNVCAWWCSWVGLRFKVGSSWQLTFWYWQYASVRCRLSCWLLWAFLSWSYPVTWSRSYTWAPSCAIPS